MRRSTSLPNNRTVRINRNLFGQFLLVWSLFLLSVSQFGLFNLAHADVLTVQGIEKGDQSLTEQQFHQGMEAYLDSDYQQAYNAWNNAAVKNHPKATFNVGRMWLLGQVPGHVENKQQARQLFQKSVDLGYAPGMKYLEQPLDTLSVNKPINPVSSNDSSINVNNQAEPIESELNVENNWLETYPNNAWVIQIFASQESNLLKQMIRDYSLKSRVQILTEKIDNALWYKLIYGQYPTKQQALDARQSLPERLRKEKPWVREVLAMKKIKKP